MAMPSFYYECWDENSGAYTLKSLLSTEPSPGPGFHTLRIKGRQLSLFFVLRAGCEDEAGW